MARFIYRGDTAQGYVEIDGIRFEKDKASGEVTNEAVAAKLRNNQEFEEVRGSAKHQLAGGVIDDQTNGTAVEVLASADGADKAKLREMLRAEKNGKQRIGVMDGLQARIDAL